MKGEGKRFISIPLENGIQKALEQAHELESQILDKGGMASYCKADYKLNGREFPLMFSPRSAMLTLYGDYVRHRGGEIGIGSLIRLLLNFGLSEQSIRSAVSRMCRMGFLKVRREGSKSYYSLTGEGLDLLTRGGSRIFEQEDRKWDGFWSTVVYFIPEERRQARDQLRRELTWIGYGPLTTATWISPHNFSKEVEEIAEKLNIRDFIQIFQARQHGCSDQRVILSRGWDLERIHQRYAAFIDKYLPRLENHNKRLKSGKKIEPSDCFVESFLLIDEYRRLPFFDPDLPQELLPKGWLRSKARSIFNEYHSLLAESANSYFGSVMKAY